MLRSGVMNRQMKHLLMFVPLTLLFAGIGVVSYDLKHPLSADEDACLVVATGSDVEPYKQENNMLYDHGAADLYDIGFDCDQMGVVTINDRESLEKGFVEAGSGATINHKTFRVWPDIWRVNVENSLDMEDTSKLPGS